VHDGLVPVPGSQHRGARPACGAAAGWPGPAAGGPARPAVGGRPAGPDELCATAALAALVRGAVAAAACAHGQRPGAHLHGLVS
jgi:hypothetical protein